MHVLPRFLSSCWTTAARREIPVGSSVRSPGGWQPSLWRREWRRREERASARPLATRSVWRAGRMMKHFSMYLHYFSLVWVISFGWLLYTVTVGEMKNLSIFIHITHFRTVHPSIHPSTSSLSSIDSFIHPPIAFRIHSSIFLIPSYLEYPSINPSIASYSGHSSTYSPFHLI